MGDLDRRKHDIDVIERVLGPIRGAEHDADARDRVVDVPLPSAGGRTRPTLELTIGLGDDDPDSRRRS